MVRFSEIQKLPNILELFPGNLRTICPRFENVGNFGRMVSAHSFEKKSKIVSHTFSQLNETTTTRYESIITLQFTNKRLSLLLNSSALVLTRQDVKYCSARELPATF